MENLIFFLPFFAVAVECRSHTTNECDCHWKTYMNFIEEVLVNKLRNTAQKKEVFYYGFLQQMWPNPQFPTDFVTFTEEILNGKTSFLCSEKLHVTDLKILLQYLEAATGGVL